MRKILSLLFFLLQFVALEAQIMEPVKFNSRLKVNHDGTGTIIFSGKIDKGWHVYSTDLGNNGPITASFHVNKMDGVKLVGRLRPGIRELSRYDGMFGMKVRYFENQAVFFQKVMFTKPKYRIDAYLEYGACSDKNCLPPTEVPIVKSGTIPVLRPKANKAESKQLAKTQKDSMIMANQPNSAEDSMTAANQNIGKVNAALWRPVVSELRQLSGNNDLMDKSLPYIFIMGFVGGLLALFMPCIWPIIPMTVSFFLKRAKGDKKKGICDASLYGVSIVVIYLLLGLFITVLFGPSKLNDISTNAVFNIFIFLLLVVFALSFFGCFELKLPDKWANAVDTKASKSTGLISIFLMAFTLALVSFSCTAPIIGLLLVETVSTGDYLAPTVGMFAFALALAIPFTLFALFPSMLKEIPRSGSWMNIVKVVLGFIELAFSLKFFSVADMAYGWHILDREVFLCLWIVLFVMLGLYLIGKLKFQSDVVGDDIGKPMPVACVMLGIVSFAFALYMVPGLWGAPCKAVSAFAPPMSTQDFNLYGKTIAPRFTNYEEGMAAARAEGKPVLIDFTGFGCVNCRKMESAVWADSYVADILTKKYVLISLYVDDKSPLPKPIEIKEHGVKRMLKTVGDKWSYLQRYKFGSNAQPFYVAVNSEGRPLTAAFGYQEDVSAYLDFLEEGLERAEKDK